MDELNSELQYDPYFAGLEGKLPDQADALQDRIDALPKTSKAFLFDPAVPDLLKKILDINGVPPQYVLAMAKIVFMTVLGDVAIGSIEQLIRKLGLEAAQASSVSNEITELLKPVITERVHLSVPAMPELPPLTQKVPVTSPVPDSSKTAGRNIIDLRKQTPSA